MRIKHALLPFLTLLVLPLTGCGGLSSSSSSSTPASVGERTLSQEGGVVTSGSDYFKVNGLVPGQDYLIGVIDESGAFRAMCAPSSSAFTYAVRAGGSNGTPSSSLTAGDYSLSVLNGALVLSAAPSTSSSSSSQSALSSGEAIPKGNKPSGLWTYADKKLSFADETGTHYLRFSNNAFGVTTSLEEASDISIFTNGSTLSSCILTQPATSPYVTAGEFDLPTYAITVKEGVILSGVSWYVGEQWFKTDELSFSPSNVDKNTWGVYPIYAILEGRDGEDYHYRETSYINNFVVASGVEEGGVLTFSDVHEEYSMIGKALYESMEEHEGKIPSLIVATGDWVNGPTPSDDVLQSVYLPQIKGQLGGIDAVYVAGNHESYLSVANASLDAGLGASEEVLDGIGVIYDSSSSDGKAHGTSSLSTGGLIVYGINYFALQNTSEDGMTTYSYDKVLDELDTFLSARKATYQGELILISAHAGLHALGVDPHSDVSTAFGGNAEYNIDHSDALVELLNSYASEWGMNFAFLFGHNHSKQESEFVLTPGERILATESFAQQRVANLPLCFAYGHAGYLSTSIGSADSHYTYIELGDDSYSLNLKKLDGLTISTRIDLR